MKENKQPFKALGSLVKVSSRPSYTTTMKDYVLRFEPHKDMQNIISTEVGRDVKLLEALLQVFEN